VVRAQASLAKVPKRESNVRKEISLKWNAFRQPIVLPKILTLSLNLYNKRNTGKKEAACEYKKILGWKDRQGALN
jgi:hypothetical protein